MFIRSITNNIYWASTYLTDNPLTRMMSGMGKICLDHIKSPFETYRKEDLSIFSEACSSGRLRYVKNYLDKNPEAIQAELNGSTKNSPLHVAVAGKQLEVAKFLIEKGADVNFCNAAGFSPIHQAAATCDNKEIIELLLQKKADLDAQGETKDTPLLIAIKYQNFVAAEIFLRYHANVSVVDDKGKSALHHYFSGSKRDPAIERSLSQPSVVNRKNKAGLTPLDVVLISGRDDPGNLIRSGAIIGEQDSLGRTPLHLALQTKDSWNASRLIHAGAPIYLTDKNGHTPLDQARLSNMEDLILALSEKESALRKNRFESVHVVERGEDGKFLKDEKNKVIQSNYQMDGWTTDLYKIESGWITRFKALMVDAGLPLYGIYFVADQSLRFVFDIMRIATRAITNFVYRFTNLEFLRSLKALTITPIWKGLRTVVWRSFKIASLPIYATGILIASLYTQIDPSEGRRLMNVIADGMDSLLLLRCAGIAKVGNLSKSQISGVAQFYLIKRDGK